MRIFVRLQVGSQLQSSVVICSDNLTIVPGVLSECIPCIFRNVSNGTISQAISTQPSITTALLVGWPGFQTASANKRLNSIQRFASFRITWAMHTAPSVMEALICLPPLRGGSRQGKVGCRGCLSYLNSNQEHTVVQMHLQRVDPISSVQDHTMVLQKGSMLYFVNNFYLCYRK